MSKPSNSHFCNCNRCKAARRAGLVLGSRPYGNYSVAAYVPFPPFRSGRRPDAVDRY